MQLDTLDTQTHRHTDRQSMAIDDRQGDRPGNQERVSKRKPACVCVLTTLELANEDLRETALPTSLNLRGSSSSPMSASPLLIDPRDRIREEAVEEDNTTENK